MNNHYQKIRDYLLELGYTITHENEEDGLFVIDDADNGINRLVIGCAEPLVIMEQYIFETKNNNKEVFKSLLKINREIVHGALVLDESGTKVIFRDTLQIENLDRNELEGSINSLSLMLTEHSNNFIEFSKN